MNISTSIEDIDLKKWDEFVLNHPQGNFFYTKEYYYSLKESKYYDSIILSCTTSDNKQLIGLLVVAIQKDYQGIIGLVTKRCVIYGAPIILDDDVNIQKKIVEYLDKKIKRKVIFIQYRFFTPIKQELLDYFKTRNYYYEPYLNILVDTSIGENNLWKQIKSSRKGGINKGKKQEFVFCTDDYKDSINIFYVLLKSTYKELKIPFPKLDYFHSLKKNVNPQNFKIFELRYNNKVIISLVALLSKNTLYGYYIGINKNKELLNLRPVDYFYWEVLRWCSLNGIHYFNWMGAGNKNKDYGVRDFKLQYGGEVFEPGRTSKFNNRLIKRAFRLLFSVWKRIN